MAERLQIRFELNATEDRLLLRISEKESPTSCIEYRFWLTRRFVNILLQAIDKLIEDDLAANVQLSPDAIAAMKKFQNEAALAKADFSTSYDANAENCKMFGEEPLLVTTLKIKKKPYGKYVLSLLDRQNFGIHLTAGMDLVHSLQKMLFDSVTNAEWNKPLFLAGEEKSPSNGPSEYMS